MHKNFFMLLFLNHAVEKIKKGGKIKWWKRKYEISTIYLWRGRSF